MEHKQKNLILLGPEEYNHSIIANILSDSEYFPDTKYTGRYKKCIMMKNHLFGDRNNAKVNIIASPEFD